MTMPIGFARIAAFSSHCAAAIAFVATDVAIMTARLRDRRRGRTYGLDGAGESGLGEVLQRGHDERGDTASEVRGALAGHREAFEEVALGDLPTPCIRPAVPSSVSLKPMALPSAPSAASPTRSNDPADSPTLELAEPTFVFMPSADEPTRSNADSSFGSRPRR